MRFKTKAFTEEQIRQMKLWPKGDYEFKVIDVLLVDKNGLPLKGGKNKAFDKYQLVLRIWDKNEKSRVIYDDLIDNEEWSWKIRHVFHATGHGAAYDADVHDTDMLIDSVGWLNLGLIPKNADFDERNKVNDYLTADKSMAVAMTQELAKDDFNDDIPTF
jgi:hypothetical protein